MANLNAAINSKKPRNQSPAKQPRYKQADLEIARISYDAEMTEKSDLALSNQKASQVATMLYGAYTDIQEHAECRTRAVWG